jgi:hypothetical protein
MRKGPRSRFLTTGRRLAVATLTLVLPGCQVAHPDFTDRSRQDCEHGDQEACRMLDALNAPQPATPSPARSKPSPRPTPLQIDVQTIMKGMAQARSSPRAGHQEDAPRPDAPLHDEPVPIQAPTDTGSPDERGP